MTSNSYGHTANYLYIDAALRSRWESFRALEEDMSKFVAKPLTDYAPYQKAETERQCKLNPTVPVEKIADMVRESVALAASYQFSSHFDQRHMTEYVTVVMLSHALSEALINAILAIGLASAGSVDLFPLLEKADFKQKWLSAPKSFAASYTFPHGTALYETLEKLAGQRNAIAHQKIELEYNGSKVLTGSNIKRQSYEEEVRWLRRFFSLPYDLADYARKAITGEPHMLLLERNPIEVAPVHNQRVGSETASNDT